MQGDAGTTARPRALHARKTGALIRAAVVMGAPPRQQLSRALSRLAAAPKPSPALSERMVRRVR